MDEWEEIYPIERVDNLNEPFWRDIKGQCLVIPPDQGLNVKLPRGLSVRLECFQVMAIVWERRKMLPAELR